MTQAKSGASLTMLNKSDARFSRKCPWVVDLENMATPGEQSQGTCGTSYLTPVKLKNFFLKNSQLNI